MKLIINIPEEYLKTIKAISDETSSFDMRKGAGMIETLKQLEYDKGYARGVENMLYVINDIKAEIEKQIERDFAFAETEELKVPCHYGTANGLQVALRIIDGVVDERISGEENNV